MCGVRAVWQLARAAAGGKKKDRRGRSRSRAILGDVVAVGAHAGFPLCRSPMFQVSVPVSLQFSFAIIRSFWTIRAPVSAVDVPFFLHSPSANLNHMGPSHFGTSQLVHGRPSCLAPRRECEVL